MLFIIEYSRLSKEKKVTFRVSVLLQMKSIVNSMTLIFIVLRSSFQSTQRTTQRNEIQQLLIPKGPNIKRMDNISKWNNVSLNN